MQHSVFCIRLSATSRYHITVCLRKLINVPFVCPNLSSSPTAQPTSRLTKPATSHSLISPAPPPQSQPRGRVRLAPGLCKPGWHNTASLEREGKKEGECKEATICPVTKQLRQFPSSFKTREINSGTEDRALSEAMDAFGEFCYHKVAAVRWCSFHKIVLEVFSQFLSLFWV